MCLLEEAPTLHVSLSVGCLVVCSPRGGETGSPPKPRGFFFDSSEYIGGGGIAPQPSSSQLRRLPRRRRDCTSGPPPQTADELIADNECRFNKLLHGFPEIINAVLSLTMRSTF